MTFACPLLTHMNVHHARTLLKGVARLARHLLWRHRHRVALWIGEHACERAGEDEGARHVFAPEEGGGEGVCEMI